MFKIVKEDELGPAANLIQDGLKDASAAMGAILQTPIDIKKINYDVENAHDIPKFSAKTDDPLHLLRTELMGDLQGVCYLILSQDEADRIISSCLAPEMVKDMKDGFLTELDNMVAAAVITQFSDQSGLTLFGHVPSLILKNPEDANKHIESESKEFSSILHFKAIFHGSELDISPDFIWMVQEEFVDKIKSVS
jgi:chemotaxis protein CheY-P-specific phosphatase CheC